MVDFACVALVDPRGWVLLQERDGNTDRWPHQWCFPGGRCEDGETSLACALRELEEETGVRVSPDDVRSLGLQVLEIPGVGRWDWEFFAARTDVGQRDVECHEGKQMLFRDPDDLEGLDLVTSAREVLDPLREWIAKNPAVLGERRFAGVLLVDRRGHVLLQERDEHAPIDPERWGLPGGHVEPGESFAEAAPRELLEETGVRLPDEALTLWGDFVIDHREAHGTWDRMQVFAADVDLDDSDVECHEGRQIVFVDPARARGLPLTRAAEQILQTWDSRSRTDGE